MLRHVAMFRLKSDAPEGTWERLARGLDRLAREIPEVTAYTHGRDLGLREGNFDLAVVADFEDPEAFAAYVGHPEHQAFLRDLLLPVVEERVSIQFALPDPS